MGKQITDLEVSCDLADPASAFAVRILLIGSILLLTGCSSLITPEREIRVTEYGAGFWSGEIGGCRVVQTGKAPAARIEYIGKTCTVVSE